MKGKSCRTDSCLHRWMQNLKEVLTLSIIML